MEITYHNIPGSDELETLARTYHCCYADLVYVVHYEKDDNKDEHYAFFYSQYLGWYEDQVLVEIVEYYPESSNVFSYTKACDGKTWCCQKSWYNV